MFGRAFSHFVRGVLCEGDEGTAEVREQHRFPPSASAVRECSGNCRGRSGSLSEIMQIVTSAVRVMYLACVQCRGTLHRGSAASCRPCNVADPHQGPVSHSGEHDFNFGFGALNATGRTVETPIGSTITLNVQDSKSISPRTSPGPTLVSTQIQVKIGREYLLPRPTRGPLHRASLRLICRLTLFVKLLHCSTGFPLLP